MTTSGLEQFSAPTRTWFEAAFAAPTEAQSGAWSAIAADRHALVVAPTGSGKTLSAFLWALDRLFTEGPAPGKTRTRVLYISPLKALAVDVERNLRAPLAGIRQTAERLGAELPEITVGLRSGDTTPADRRRLQTRPPDILITTPESLFLMLTSQARETLQGVETVIIDEVHAVAGTKRGAHLALSLERLDALLTRPAQRIGLSATVRPIEEVARFLGGSAPVEVVAPTSTKEWDLQVVVPVADLNALDEDTREDDPRKGSLWPHIEERVVDLIEAHRSTIVFANSRRLAERLTARLNEVHADRLEARGQAADGDLARAHHGSVSKEQRAVIEDDLKRGRLPCVVATSSLELGIDMGAVDLVIQIESPPSVASALQRVGRAGHQVGEISRGVLFPKHRGDLAPTAVAVERMRAGAIESLRMPANPLDVLAQHIVAATALDAWEVDALFDLVRRAAPYVALPRSAYEATLDLLAGRYPSEDFAELRPRVVWDRVQGVVTARPGAQRLAVTSGGTIPDRGLFGVFLVGATQGGRVGELDEEMVYESRVGDLFTLGTSTWRIEDITHDRVLVSPAPGQPGRVPFWHGDTLGRPAELGEAVGAFSRELATSSRKKALARATAAGLDAWAADNLVQLIEDQREATQIVPNDRQLLIERFHDELGDWRLIVHSPYGLGVHAPWALIVNARLRERYGVEAQALASDDGLVLRIPETDQDPPGADLIAFEPDEIEDLVTREVGGSALFASRFRECAARALLLPRRDPGRRSPLWQQRQRSAQLLEVAARYPSFPIVLETIREVLQDVYDVPALLDIQRRIAARSVTVSEVTTERPSPFAQTLLFGYVAAFIYEGDSPLAERRAAALTLDQGLLAELLGRAELRELLDPEAIAEVEAELQHLAPDRRVRGIEGIADLLRTIGPLSTEEIAARTREVEGGQAVDDLLDELTRARRIVEVRIAGESRWAAVEDIARLRDGLGVPVPPGTASAFTDPVEDPIGDLVLRYARSHGPFTAAEVAERWGLGVAIARHALLKLSANGRVVEGEFRPAGSGAEWCESGVLRRLRRRSLARLRNEVEPVEPTTLARFLPAWQQVGGRLRGVDGVLTVVEQLAGVAIPASAWESLVFPARLADYTPAMLDELTASGEVLWRGEGGISGSDGWVSLHPADGPLIGVATEFEPDEAESRILEVLGGGGGFFFRQLSDVLEEKDTTALSAALWRLVWSGRVGNDTWTPLRAYIGGGTHKVRRAAPRARTGRPGRGPMTVRSGPPETAGRWFVLPHPLEDATRSAHATGEILLERHGVVTRGAVLSERVTQGFAPTYKVLSAFEEAGRCRRGYFVEGLGAAQFGTAGAVDRLRTFSVLDESAAPTAIALAATDPANPYGAALPWPDREAGHRPGRKAGALVVLVDGALAIYVERGGRSLLTFADDATLGPAVAALGTAIRRGALGRLTVEKADGASVLGPDSEGLRRALESAGFVATSRGLRLRSA
ncbi:MAG: ATP-dependent helicase [Marmoricola sp.]